jgi:drug/metabolite transporter (DMT)-like permease
VSNNIKAYLMLVLASIFWAGNFIVGKFAFFENIPPFSLVFCRWLFVWIILFPFTYKEILNIRKNIFENISLLFLLGLTSVGLFNSFVYIALNYTQVINASLFNTAIPATIILLCFLFKIENTNLYQLTGLIISVFGVLAIITRLDLNILIKLNFNIGDVWMICAVMCWGIYSAFLKKLKLKISLLSLVHILCTFGLLFLFPQFIYEYTQGDVININKTFLYCLLYLALFPSIGSYYCWAGAVSIIGPNRAGIFLMLIPLFSAAMAIFFFDEKFESYHFVGSIFVIIGLFLANKKIKNVKN